MQMRLLERNRRSWKEESKEGLNTVKNYLAGLEGRIGMKLRNKSKLLYVL